MPKAMPYCIIVYRLLAFFVFRVPTSGVVSNLKHSAIIYHLQIHVNFYKLMLQEELDILQYSDEDPVETALLVHDRSSGDQMVSSDVARSREPDAINAPATSSAPTASSEPRRPLPYSGNIALPGGTRDRYGLMCSHHLPQEDVVYTVTKEPHHKPTRVVFVGNLRKPLDAMSFQDHLTVLVRRAHPLYKIVRVWMNRSRTHALVLTGSVETARALRRQLNGSKYPDSSEREYLARFASHLSGAEITSIDMQSLVQYELFVDYLNFHHMSQFIFEEDYGPKNAKWRVDYRFQGEHGEVAAEHTLLEGDFRPVRGTRRLATFWSSYVPDSYVPNSYVPDRSETARRQAHVTRSLDPRSVSKR